ncbi:hypothetical protein Btru_023341 [Bulinus truncatus]|nr:hypothetical protein Btru_023341 [Bulinus truncatus]
MLLLIVAQHQLKMCNHSNLMLLTDINRQLNAFKDTMMADYTSLEKENQVMRDELSHILKSCLDEAVAPVLTKVTKKKVSQAHKRVNNEKIQVATLKKVQVTISSQLFLVLAKSNLRKFESIAKLESTTPVARTGSSSNTPSSKTNTSLSSGEQKQQIFIQPAKVDKLKMTTSSQKEPAKIKPLVRRPQLHTNSECGPCKPNIRSVKSVSNNLM